MIKPNSYSVESVSDLIGAVGSIPGRDRKRFLARLRPDGPTVSAATWGQTDWVQIRCYQFLLAMPGWLTVWKSQVVPHPENIQVAGLCTYLLRSGVNPINFLQGCIYKVVKWSGSKIQFIHTSLHVKKQNSESTLADEH